MPTALMPSGHVVHPVFSQRLALGSCALIWSTEYARGTLLRNVHKRSKHWAADGFYSTLLGLVLIPRPLVQDRPSHRFDHRPHHTQGSGSCTRRSECSAAFHGVHRQTFGYGRYRLTPHGSVLAHLHPLDVAGHLRKSCTR